MITGMDEAAQNSAELPDDIASLRALVGEKIAFLREKDFEIARLKEEIALLIHKRFGASSEKASPDQLGLFNEAEATAAATVDGEAASEPDATVTVPEHTRKKGGRRPLPADLERVRIVHDIAAAEKICPCGSGKQRRPAGEVVSEQIDIVPARIRVLQHARQKYGPCEDCDGVFPEACACGHDHYDETAAPSTPKGEGSGVEMDAHASEPSATPGDKPEPRVIVLAQMPPQPIPKSNASPGTCAYIA
jgi:hypothetical protein